MPPRRAADAARHAGNAGGATLPGHRRRRRRGSDPARIGVLLVLRPHRHRHPVLDRRQARDGARARSRAARPGWGPGPHGRGSARRAGSRPRAARRAVHRRRGGQGKRRSVCRPRAPPPLRGGTGPLGRIAGPHVLVDEALRASGRELEASGSGGADAGFAGIQQSARAAARTLPGAVADRRAAQQRRQQGVGGKLVERTRADQRAGGAGEVARPGPGFRQRAQQHLAQGRLRSSAGGAALSAATNWARSRGVGAAQCRHAAPAQRRRSRRPVKSAWTQIFVCRREAWAGRDARSSRRCLSAVPGHPARTRARYGPPACSARARGARGGFPACWGWPAPADIAEIAEAAGRGRQFGGVAVVRRSPRRGGRARAGGDARLWCRGDASVWRRRLWRRRLWRRRLWRRQRVRGRRRSGRARRRGGPAPVRSGRADAARRDGAGGGEAAPASELAASMCPARCCAPAAAKARRRSGAAIPAFRPCAVACDSSPDAATARGAGAIRSAPAPGRLAGRAPGCYASLPLQQPGPSNNERHRRHHRPRNPRQPRQPHHRGRRRAGKRRHRPRRGALRRVHRRA